MSILENLLILLLISTSYVKAEKSTLKEELDEYNSQLLKFDHEKALIAWNMSLYPDENLMAANEEITIKKNLWNNNWCKKMIKKAFANFDEMRQVYLVCRGPRFTSYQLSNLLAALTKMSTTYTSTRVCIRGHCMKMEPELNRFMEEVRDERLLRESWMKWHKIVGTAVRPNYIYLIKMLNSGARGAGYENAGLLWRDETEIPNLKALALRLHSEVDYLYKLLHSYVRFRISQFYGINITDGIPAHLLGNMWSQKWDGLFSIIYPEESFAAHDGLVKEHLPPNATVIDMVKSAEQFFISMGFPKLPEHFYENSHFTEQNDNQNCHGTSANMFGQDDYRVIMCSEMKDEDFITIHHELGHIYYFMAYKNLPTLYQDGANSAFHESVGDSITYSLQKRNLKSLMKIGLAKLPQIAFGLVVDLWRWTIFEEENSADEWNDIWWELNYKYLGVIPPRGYATDGFDAAGKFHIIDNMPYIRYFLASFLQMQFYEAMCKGEFCDLRSNKRAGDKLWKMMEKGSSQHWSITLKEFVGTSEINSKSLLRFFEPLKVWLEEQVIEHDLKIGWGYR